MIGPQFPDKINVVKPSDAVEPITKKAVTDPIRLSTQDAARHSFHDLQNAETSSNKLHIEHVKFEKQSFWTPFIKLIQSIFYAIITKLFFNSVKPEPAPQKETTNPIRLDLSEDLTVQWLDKTEDESKVWGPPEQLFSRNENGQKINKPQVPVSDSQNTSVVAEDELKQYAEEIKEVANVLPDDRPLNQTQKDKLIKIFEKYPDMSAKITALAKAVSTAREVLMSNDDPEMYFAFNLREESKPVVDAMTGIMDSLGNMTSDEVKFLYEVAMLISGSVLIGNQQIQTDGFRLGLLDQTVDLPGKPLHSKSVAEELREKLSQSDEKLSDPTLIRTLNNNYIFPAVKWAEDIDNAATQVEMDKLNLERGFIDREGGSSLKQKVRWENPIYNELGGLTRATRVVSFLNTRGEITHVKESMDLSSLVKPLSYKQSIMFMRFVQFIQYDLDSELVAKWMIECQRDRDRSPIDILTSLPEVNRNDKSAKDKLLQRIQDYIDPLSLSGSEKDKLLRIGIDFSFNMGSAIPKALISM